ncbi:hypothetical protein MMC34_005166 [Xylographa carneopallida]|nr:hypothetical protein [Xylographa carneopallida]
MPSEDYMSDEYVAKLMSKDAKDTTMRYSALGIQALLPKRPTTNAPRPNTRFLKNIIRETDSHNAALKSKETKEAKLRLGRLHGVSDPQGNSRDWKRGNSPEERLFRYEDDDGEYGGRQKRRRLDHEVEPKDGRSRRSDPPGSRASTRVMERDRSGKERLRRHRRDVSSEVEHSDSERSFRQRHRRHHHRSRRIRTRSSSADQSADRSRHRRDRDRDKDRRKRRSRSRNRDRAPGNRKPHQRKASRSPTSDAKMPTKTTRAPTPPSNPDDTDSDPLEFLLGPAPPPPPSKVRTRGRGTFASSSAMDAHFSSTYDPTVDVMPNSDSENDWDQALEALRDRRRWQQQGADRLRAAGFTEEEVGKWEKGGEKTEEDVKWKGRGEGREWDRGKVVGEEGVETRPEWGRLKGA